MAYLCVVQEREGTARSVCVVWHGMYVQKGKRLLAVSPCIYCACPCYVGCLLCCAVLCYACAFARAVERVKRSGGRLCLVLRINPRRAVCAHRTLGERVQVPCCRAVDWANPLTALIYPLAHTSMQRAQQQKHGNYKTTYNPKVTQKYVHVYVVLTGHSDSGQL